MHKSLLLLMALAMLTACGGEKKEKKDIIIAEKYVPKKPMPPIRQQPLLSQTEVRWLGGNYQIEIDRQAEDSLPQVKDAQGQPYVDNSVTLTIKRGDGSQFFRRRFTKQNLDACLDNTFRRQGILDGMAFDTIADNRLRFGLQLVFPDADDMFLPISVLIDRQGNCSVARDTSTEF